MALVYKRSDSKTARAYARSRGMEPNGVKPNPGVSHLTVVQNPSGRRTSRRVKENPFQWIEGRGQRHRHASPEYKTLEGAAAWKKRNRQSKARLYPVDRRGTIVSRPVSQKLLSNGGSEMAYDIGALRRAMRSNPRGRRVSEKETKGGVKVSSRGKKPVRNRKRRTSRKGAPKRNSSRRRSSRKPKRNRRSTRRRSSRRPRKNARRSSKRRRSTRRRRSSRKPKRNSRRRSTRRRRSSRKPKRNSRRRSTRRRRSSRKPKRNTRRRSTRRRSTRRPRKNARRSSKRRSSKRRRSSRRYHGSREVKARGAEYLDKYIKKGYMPTVAPRYRTGKSRSGIPPVLVYPVAKGQGRLSSRKTRRTTKSRRGPRKRTRATSVGATYRGRRKRRMTANRKRRSSRRRSTRRRSSRRRRTRPGLYKNRGRRSTRRRSSRRRSSRRRSTRRRRSRPVRPNLLSTAKARWGGKGKYRTGRPVGRTFQVLAYGPGSKTRKTKKGKQRRVKGYPVYIPGHVIETAAVRRYRGLGGAASDAHRRAKRSGYAERKKYPRRRVRKNTRRTSMRRNRRKSRRKSTRRRSTRRRSTRRRTRRNPRYVVKNRRRRSSRRKRRVRRNAGILGGADIMKDVVTPVLGGTIGFMAARVLSNGIANVEGVRSILDKDKPAAEATNTKIAANVLGIVATLSLAPRVRLIRDNQGALVTGMGLALTDRLLGMYAGAGGYLGEYVSSPLGEYVSSPLGEYVSSPLGAYVQDPSAGMGDTLYAAAGLGAGVMEAAAGMGAMQAAAGYSEGVDPGNQSSIDHMMDGMEGAMYATAGMGETLYAAAGLGAEADAGLKSMYAKEQPPFASIQTPTDIARPVSKTLPYAKPVPDSLVTPEGKGYAGGLFARNLFAGML